MSYEATFWKKVSKTETCWLWTGGKNEKGYGIFWCGSFQKAHRFSWALVSGHPGKNWVLHRCDVPACVNPEHLFLGDSKTNVTDMWSKGRASTPPPMGGWNKKSIPKETIKKLGTASDVDLGKEVGLSKWVIAKARRRLNIPAFPTQTLFKKGTPHPRWSRGKESHLSHGKNNS